MRRISRLLVVGAIPAAVLFGGGAALAAHDHYLVTPGTCVEDIAIGQTSKGPGEPGFHQFHENVHLGTPGTFAFDQSNNPVDVFKGETCPQQ